MCTWNSGIRVKAQSSCFQVIASIKKFDAQNIHKLSGIVLAYIFVVSSMEICPNNCRFDHKLQHIKVSLIITLLLQGLWNKLSPMDAFLERIFKKKLPVEKWNVTWHAFHPPNSLKVSVSTSPFSYDIVAGLQCFIFLSSYVLLRGLSVYCKILINKSIARSSVSATL